MAWRDAIGAMLGITTETDPQEPDRTKATEQTFEVMPGQGLFLRDVTRYNYDTLISNKTIKIIDEMMRDDQVKASMSLKQHAPVAGGWEIRPASDDNRHEEQAEFIRTNLNKMRGSVEELLEKVTDALPYGFSLIEMVLKDEAGKLWLDRTVHHAPHNINWISNKEGNQIVGAEQFGGSNEILHLWKALYYVWNGKYENPWGQTDLDAAYRPWFLKDWTIRHLGMLIERMALQRLLVTYEQHMADFANDVVDEWVEAIGLAIPEGVTVDFSDTSKTKGSSEIFAKVIEVSDQAIARSILKQTLAQGEGIRVGSLAMARVHQDTLLMEMAKVQKDVEETVMTEQFIRLLIDLNFGPQDEYPAFKIGEMFPVETGDFIEWYTTLIKEGGITPTKADEERIRELAKLPPREGDDPPPGRSARGGNSGGAPPAPFRHEQEEYLKACNRPLTESEKRIDFAKIENRLDTVGETTVRQLEAVVDKIEEKVMKDVTRRFFKNGLANAREVNKINIPFLGEFRRVLESSGQVVAESGVKDLQAQAKKAKFTAANPGGLTFPQQISAFNTHWAATSQAVATEFGQEIEREVRHVLLNALQNGETQRATEQKLIQVFEQFTTGTTKAGAAVSPWRLETIVRTNLTSVYNQGRLIASRDPDLAGFILGYQFSAVLDERTSDICDSLDGIVVAFNDPMVDHITPPVHFNCRSILVEVLMGETLNLSSDKAVNSAAADIQSEFK